MKSDNPASEAARALAAKRWKKTTKAERSAFASAIGSAPRPGRRVMSPCPYCGAEFSARDLREHRPRCAKR